VTLVAAKNEIAAAAAAAAEAVRALSDDDIGESFMSRRERNAVSVSVVVVFFCSNGIRCLLESV
jgi:hypothetical protein